MKGASGAGINLCGDYVLKNCSDAREQVEWFIKAKEHGLQSGIRLPYTDLEDRETYRMEFIRGHMATAEPTVLFIDTLLSQVDHWSRVPANSIASWDDYLLRIEEHVREGCTGVMKSALAYTESIDPLPPSFCHGDLTFENVLIESDGTLVLIDPNFKTNLYQSYMLDVGKLLQSTLADYHRIFGSNFAIDLSRHTTHLLKRVSQRAGDALYEERARAALLSHVVRLRKYRPESQRPIVDNLLAELLP